jgi:hypothetical protein
LENIRYDNDWIKHAIPGHYYTTENYLLETCLKYKPNKNMSGNNSIDFCPESLFSKEIEKCDEWVFDENESTIVKEVIFY